MLHSHSAESLMSGIEKTNGQNTTPKRIACHLTCFQRMCNEARPGTPGTIEMDEHALFNSFSPETTSLLRGLGDSPESLKLKSEYLQSLNRLQRGRHPIKMFQFWFAPCCACVCAGYSSGSAGGTVTPQNSVPGKEASELSREGKSEPEPPKPEVPAPPQSLATEAAPPPADAMLSEARMKELEADMLARLEERMKKLEAEMRLDLVNQKRQAEEELEEQLNGKRRKVEKDLENAIQQKAEEEEKLAAANELLQEKMLSVSEEERALEDLRQRSIQMQANLEKAAQELQAQQKETRELETEKERKKNPVESKA